MSENPQGTSSRREFLKNTSCVAAASALAGTSVPFVHAGEDNTIRVALVGCGGRGTGAAVNALTVKHGPVKLVAMADVFKDRLDRSYAAIKKRTRPVGDRRSTCPTIASSSASTPTRRRWIVSSRATWRSLPLRWHFAGCILATRSRRG